MHMDLKKINHRIHNIYHIIYYAIIRSKAKVTDGQGHRNSHKMAIDHWSWPTLCLNKMLIKLDEPSPVFYHFTSQNMCMIKFYKN